MPLRKDKPETHQPTQAEMEEEFEIDGTPDEIAAAVLVGGAARRDSDQTPER